MELIHMAGGYMYTYMEFRDIATAYIHICGIHPYGGRQFTSREEAYHSACKCTRRSFGLVSHIVACFGDSRR